MSAPTEVELFYMKGKIERWIRFGKPIAERTLDRRRRIATFEAGAIFTFMRWASNGHWTLVSRVHILRPCNASEVCSTVPGVRPGAELLLRAVGWHKVQRVLRATDAVQALGFAPYEIGPDLWRHVHSRLVAGLPPRSCSREQHRAWLLRSKIEIQS